MCGLEKIDKSLSSYANREDVDMDVGTADVTLRRLASSDSVHSRNVCFVIAHFFTLMTSIKLLRAFDLSRALVACLFELLARTYRTV